MEDDNELDLDGLKNFSFQPAWSKQRSHRFPQDGDDSRVRMRVRSNGSYRDGSRREHRNRASNENGEDSQMVRPHFRRTSPDRYSNKKGNKYDKRGKGPFVKREFEPIVEAEFYPDDAQFETIINACRLTCKTYELFSIARLFLEKPERFVVVIKKIPSQKDPALFLSVDDGFVFLDEQSAVQCILENHLDKYFSVTEEVGEEPKGIFVCIHKCGFTGKVLCPPNYHRYQEILLEHHDTYLPNMNFERFKSKIERISDPETIDAWKKEAAKTISYTPKLEGHDEKFTKFSELRHFFVEHFKEKAIRSADSFRITGTSFMNMPRGVLSKSIFTLLMREKKFPLKFSNNLRGKLRRAHFTIYKVQSEKSKTKIACICAVKRKFRSTEDKFEDGIQKIIDFIDAHQGVKISDLYGLLYPEAPEHIAGEQDEKFSAFAKDLNWLIHEGYVSEFEDGRLVSTAIMTKEQLEAMKKAEKAKASTAKDDSAIENDAKIDVENDADGNKDVVAISTNISTNNGEGDDEPVENEEADSESVTETPDSSDTLF